MDAIKFANYGQERTINATPEELQIFELIVNAAETDRIKLTRKSDSYVTAKYRGWDLARFKYTPRAKWIMFPMFELGSVKNRIQKPEDVLTFSEKIKDSIAEIEKMK